MCWWQGRARCVLNTGGCGCAHGLVRGSSRWGVPEVCGPTAGHGVLFVLFVCLLPSPLPPQSPRSVLWKQVLKSTGSPSGSLLVARPLSLSTSSARTASAAPGVTAAVTAGSVASCWSIPPTVEPQVDGSWGYWSAVQGTLV